MSLSAKRKEFILEWYAMWVYPAIRTYVRLLHLLRAATGFLPIARLLTIAYFATSLMSNITVAALD